MNNMNKNINKIFFVLFVSLLLAGCACNSGQYTTDGNCCTSVCDKGCSSGYKEGSCNCECVLFSENNTNTDVAGVFDNPSDVEPPVIPN